MRAPSAPLHPSRVDALLAFAASVALALLAGCSSSGNSSFGDGGTGGPDGTFTTADGMVIPIPPKKEAGPLMMTGIPDAGFSSDAFFATDPEPKYCVVDGGAAPPTPGGTPMCPSDKNREGCPCPMIGATAACWPGLRVDRNIGDCKDGTTTCVSTDEGTNSVWGACQGYVLPTPGATAGAAACKCFSSGQWNLSNLSPCFITYNPGGSFAVSSYQTDGGIACPMGSDTPPPEPQPGVPWSTDTLKVDCAGSFTLCYTIKAGSATNPQPSDCVVGQSCVSGDYLTANATQPFPPLPGWPAAGAPSTASCAAEFLANGGYGEMSVKGLSELCEPIGADDGGTPAVFNRVPYCSMTCQMNPMAAGCGNCQTGGSGTFGG